MCTDDRGQCGPQKCGVVCIRHRLCKSKNDIQDIRIALSNHYQKKEYESIHSNQHLINSMNVEPRGDRQTNLKLSKKEIIVCSVSRQP